MYIGGGQTDGLVYVATRIKIFSVKGCRDDSEEKQNQVTRACNMFNPRCREVTHVMIVACPHYLSYCIIYITCCTCLISLIFGTLLFQVMPAINVAFLTPSYYLCLHMLHLVPMLFMTVIPASFNVTYCIHKSWVVVSELHLSICSVW